jgi:hypothetical protein
MTSRKLANVLIKILGIYILLEAIPSGCSGVISGFIAMSHTHIADGVVSITWGVSSLIQAAIGLLLILKSQWISEWLLKGEDA